jgi:inner membrane protein
VGDWARRLRLNPITHFLVGWTVAEIAKLESRRDRAIVAVACVVPDLDGFGIVAEKATLAAGWEEPLLWWTLYHHVLCHNLAFGLVVAGVAAWLASAQKGRIAGLALLSFHLHLFGDLVGAKGPEGFLWPIPYLSPFSEAWLWSWEGAWELNAWPNIAFTGVLLALAFRFAWARGHSPVELVSRRVDGAFVGALRERFGSPTSAQ